VWLNNECFGNLYLLEFPLTLPCSKNTGALERISSQANTTDLSPKLSIQNVEAWAGVGVGGSSLINNGITYRPLRAGWELAFDLDEMPYMNSLWNDLEQTYFARAESILLPTPIPEDILASDYYENVRLHVQHMFSGGYPLTNGNDGNELHGTSMMPMIVDWNKVRDEIAGTRTASVIDGEAWWGINSDAKFSLDKADNYIGKAISTGHVNIRPLHTVRSIGFDPDQQLYTLKISRTNLAYQVQEEITVTTPTLIVAAGSLGTTKLMIAAKNQGGLPNLNEHVGTRWTNNGNTATLRIVSDEKVSQGGPAGSKSTNFDDPNAPLTIENLSQKVPAFVSLDPEGAPLVGSVLTIAVGVPSKFGRFSWDDTTDTVKLYWPEDGAKNIYDKFFAIMTELDAYGAHRVMPIEQAQRLTVHPLGGMPLGLATDEYCQVKNYDSLYVVDGSVLPGPSALANPSLLISSIAERCAEKIVAQILNESE